VSAAWLAFLYCFMALGLFTASVMGAIEGQWPISGALSVGSIGAALVTRRLSRKAV
jgi:hypothetical protein